MMRGVKGMITKSSPGSVVLPQRYVVVLLTFLCTSVCYIERVGFPLAYTASATSSTSETTKGFILSAFYYGYVLSQVPGGWAAQRFGGRIVLFFSFLAWSTACALTACTSTFVSVVMARLVVGVAQGFIFPSVHTILARWVPPHERSRSVSLATSGMYLGAAVGMASLPPLATAAGPHSVFLAESALGLSWALLWLRLSREPHRAEHSKSVYSAHDVDDSSKRSLLPSIHSKENGNNHSKHSDSTDIPWKRILVSPPVWAIVVNNFTFHYALYVLMNWLPTYFNQGLQISLKTLGLSKMFPYLNMFVFSNIGGIVADHLIVNKRLSVTATRKLLNTGGFFVAASALVVMPHLRSGAGAIACSSICLGFCALSRAGFAVNHMDIAPRFAGIVMGVSNTAGTLAGIVGVTMTGQLLEASKAAGLEISDPRSWTMVFVTPAVLCIASALLFLVFATGNRVFD